MVLNNDNSESRRALETCYKKHSVIINPIINWEDADVWGFIRSEKIPYCGLYDDGQTRIGCIGCPMAGQHGRERAFCRWPKYKTLYLHAFDRMLKKLDERGRPHKWKTAEEVFNWWMEYDILPGQIGFDDLEDEDE